MTVAHTSSAAAASAAKHALTETARTALAGQLDYEGSPVDISFGLRWPPVAHAAVAVTSVEWEPTQVDEQAGLGRRRTRYDDVTIGVSAFAEVPGNDEATEIAAHDRAFSLIALLSQYLRDGDNTTLGNVALWCFQTTARSDGATDEDDQHNLWRVIEVAATFVARVQIREQ